MALKIRLARGGAKKRPFYRIVVAEATAPRDGRFVERIGSYNPFLEHGHKERVVLNAERAKYWLSVGSQPTDRVIGFLANINLVEKPANSVTPKKSQPKKKAQERLKAAEEAASAAATAAAAPAPEPVAAPAEEASAPVEVPTETPAEAPVEEVTAPAEEVPAEAPAEESSEPTA